MKGWKWGGGDQVGGRIPAAEQRSGNQHKLLPSMDVNVFTEKGLAKITGPVSLSLHSFTDFDMCTL